MDSMRESAGVQRHDAPNLAAQLPEGEAAEPGTIDKIKESISGVAGASQTMGWGAHGDKKMVKVEGSGAAPSAEAGSAGVDVSAPTADVDVSASVPAVEGTVDVPAAEGGLEIPSGSADVSGELINFANRQPCFFNFLPARLSGVISRVVYDTSCRRKGKIFLFASCGVLVRFPLHHAYRIFQALRQLTPPPPSLCILDTLLSPSWFQPRPLRH